MTPRRAPAHPPPTPALPASAPCVLIDDRAGSRSLASLPPLDSLAVLTRLDAGDVCLAGNGPRGPVSVGVEVKSLADLIASIDTGRLSETQVPPLLHAYDVPYVAFYGEYRCGEGGVLETRFSAEGGKRWGVFRAGTRKYYYRGLESYLLTLSALGVRVRHDVSPASCASWLGALAAWWAKPWSEHTGLHQLDCSREPSLLPGFDDETMARVRVAAALPGLGFSRGQSRAAAAALHFPSIAAMMTADERAWQEVPGIGKGLAAKLVAFVRAERRAKKQSHTS